MSTTPAQMATQDALATYADAWGYTVFSHVSTGGIDISNADFCISAHIGEDGRMTNAQVDSDSCTMQETTDLHKVFEWITTYG